jgi:hypothetical protein
MLKNHMVLSKTFPSSKLNLPKKPGVVKVEKEPFIKTREISSSLGPPRHAVSPGRSQPTLDDHESSGKSRPS